MIERVSVVAVAVLLTATFAEGAIATTSVDLLTMPIATSFAMPIGDRSVDLRTALTGGLYMNRPTMLFPGQFREFGNFDCSLAGPPAGPLRNGWYVFTPFNSNITILGEPYSKLGDYHPGEDWNGQDTIAGDECQPVFAVADGVVIGKGDAGLGWGNMLFTLHRLASGELFVSVYAHLIRIPDIPLGSVVQKSSYLANVGHSGTDSPHLHWEIRRASFLDAVGGTVTMKSASPYKPTTWPAFESPGDRGRSFIRANYCEPSVFVREGACVFFDFALDRLQINGNVNFLDEFDNNVINSNIGCLQQTSEGGGFLNLRSGDGANQFSPGFLVDNCILGLQPPNSNLAIQLGRGNATIEATFRADTPVRDQAYGVQVFTVGTNELVNIAVSNCGATSCVAGVVLPVSAPASPIALDLRGAQQITLRLFVEDGTGNVSASFSVDGGAPVPVVYPVAARVLTLGTRAVVSVFGSVKIP